MKAVEVERELYNETLSCPFCKNKPHAIVTPGHIGFCALIQCINPNCPVTPSTPMFNAKSKQGALSKARKAWETRKKIKPTSK